METEWIKCPVCSCKTRNKIRTDTILQNFPLYCHKCKQESLINVKSLNIEIVNEVKQTISIGTEVHNEKV